MKKARVLVIAIAVALMAMGIGYAAWSQILPMTVDGNTSHIDVIYSDAQVTYEKYLDVTATKASNGKSLAVVANDFYPNAQCVFTATITNNGTMPVVLKSFTMVPDSNLLGTENPANYIMSIKSNSTDPALNLDIANLLFQLDDIKNVSVTPIRIEPNGGSFTMTYTLKMDDVVGLPGANPYEEKDFAFSLTPYFETTSQE